MNNHITFDGDELAFWADDKKVVGLRIGSLRFYCHLIADWCDGEISRADLLDEVTPAAPQKKTATGPVEGIADTESSM